MIRIRKAIGIDKVGSCGSQTGRLLVHHGYEALKMCIRDRYNMVIDRKAVIRAPGHNVVLVAGRQDLDLSEIRIAFIDVVNSCYRSLGPYLVPVLGVFLHQIISRLKFAVLPGVHIVIRIICVINIAGHKMCIRDRSMTVVYMLSL